MAGPNPISGNYDSFSYLDLMLRPADYVNVDAIYVKNKAVRGEIAAALRRSLDQNPPAAAPDLGEVRNAIRSNPIQLIQRASEAPLADRSGDGEGDTDTAVSRGAVALDEMKQLYDEGMTVILDARGPGDSAEDHIPGAVNIPYH